MTRIFENIDEKLYKKENLFFDVILNVLKCSML